MHKKREVIIIISILLLFFIIAFFWQNTASSTATKDEETPTSTNKYVYVKITGEVKLEKTIKIPVGYTYGYVILKINPLLNDYSYIEYDEKEKILKDTTIEVRSVDYRKDYYDNSEGKISVNQASKYDLMKIYGIGEARSIKIIEYRNKKIITTWDELKKIIGVSNEVMERIKEQAVL